MRRELDRPFDSLSTDEKALVFDFVGYFSRMEYSMKRAGFIRQNNGTVEADWQKFAKKNQAAFEACNLNDLCPTLYENPPMKEVVDERGEIRWQVVPPQGSPSSLLTLSLSLRRARNNLFHGGKYHGELVAGTERSDLLLREGIKLIEYLAELDGGVKHNWDS